MSRSNPALAIYLKTALVVCIILGSLTLLQALGLGLHLVGRISRMEDGLTTPADIVRIVISLVLVVGFAGLFLIPIFLRKLSWVTTYYLVLGILLSVVFGLSSLGLVLQPVLQSMATRGGGGALALTIMLAMTCVGIWLIMIGSNSQIRAHQKTVSQQGNPAT